jgi:hypothetical protein
MLHFHPTAVLTCTLHCSLLAMLAGFEAIRSGKEWKGLADGLISGIVLGAAWKGVSIVSDKAGLTKQVSSTLLLLPEPMHAYVLVCYPQQQCEGATHHGPAWFYCVLVLLACPLTAGQHLPCEHLATLHIARSGVVQCAPAFIIVLVFTIMVVAACPDVLPVAIDNISACSTIAMHVDLCLISPSAAAAAALPSHHPRCITAAEQG